MNHSLITADRGARFRMVAAATVCAAVFIGAMAASAASGKAQDARFAGPAVVKAGQPTAIASHEGARIVR
jgi:hypothetical protein